MADKKVKETVDTKIKNEEVAATERKVAAAKEANRDAAQAAKKAAKLNAEATAAVAKDTAKKTQKAAKEAAKKGSETAKKAAKKGEETAKKAAKKAASATKDATEKVKESAENSRKKYTPKPKRNVWIQYLGREFSEDELIERALAQFAATEGAVQVKKVTLYIKPEEMAAYYVINEQYTGRVEF